MVHLVCSQSIIKTHTYRFQHPSNRDIACVASLLNHWLILNFGGFSEVAGDGNHHPHHPNESSAHTVCNLAGSRNTCQLHSEAAVDDAQSDEGPSRPNMGVRPDLAFSFAFVRDVVNYSEQGLDSKQAEYC